MKSFKNTTALISGASSGIGLGLATALAAEGARVAITGTNEDKLAAASASLRAGGATVMTLQFDVADEGAWGEAARRVETDWGPIHFLGLNAGIALLGRSIESTPTEYWRLSWDLNVMGVIYGLQACLPGMRVHGEPGHILITSSIGGVIPLWGLGPYGVTKAGAVMLAEILREELKGSSLNASVMCPSAVRTDLPNNVNRRVPGAWTETALANSKPSMDAGLDPVDVGRFTLARIKDGDLYIFTHNVGEEVIRTRSEEMDAARMHGSDAGQKSFSRIDR